jgi:hypothetical protein
MLEQPQQSPGCDCEVEIEVLNLPSEPCRNLTDSCSYAGNDPAPNPEGTVTLQRCVIDASSQGLEPTIW